MNKLDITNLKALENKFRNIQKNIAKSLFKLNRKHPNTISKNWKRKEGGGGKSISISGDVIEKAAVNFSSISGTNLPGSSISSKIQIKNLSRFHAVGVSVISHPSNPFCPTSHMNVRIFFVLGKNNKIKDWWIGGGFDLTPYFSTNKENAFWHNQAKAMLEKFNKNYYKKFAKECDEYFYLPHRNEKRGIGGVFFDQLQHGDIENSLKLIQEVANCFIGSYLDIVNNTKNKSFSIADKDFQLYRRGRYVEFNLLFDRGTKFGIESNGRADSILASLPPTVTWPNKLSPALKAKEKKLLKFLGKNWDEHI